MKIALLMCFIADMPYYDGENRRDVLIRQIREAIAEDNRKEIIERLWKGRQERTRKGRAPGGNAPYGYRRLERCLFPDETEALIVRLIFELSGLGYSSAEIAQELSEEGHKQRNGRAWTPRQVRAALARRRLYETGLIRYGSIEGINENLVLLTKTDGDQDEKIGIGAAL
jgi:DNA invertase Pin-like site-specific DNA recombinase